MRSRLSEAAQSSTISPSSMRLITIPQILIGRPRLWPSATQREATRSPSLTWSSTRILRSPSLKTSW